ILLHHIDQHRRANWSSVLFACSFCPGNTFISSEEFRQHILSEHSDENYLFCADCSKNFSSITSLIQHISASRYKMYVCSLCNHTHCSLMQVKAHIAKKHVGCVVYLKKKEVSGKCAMEKEWNKMLMTYKKILSTAKKSTTRNTESFAKKSVSKQSAKNSDQAAAQIDFTESVGIGCQKCGQNLSMTDLETHHKKCQSEESITATCEACGQQVKMKDLDTHDRQCQKTKTNPNGLMYECGTCGTLESSPSLIKGHMSICTPTVEKLPWSLPSSEPDASIQRVYSCGFCPYNA
ncbi:unnamed protein product, partial [Owenia fusiformis]